MLVLLQEPERYAEIMVVFYEASSVARGESLCLAKHNQLQRSPVWARVSLSPDHA